MGLEVIDIAVTGVHLFYQHRTRKAAKSHDFAAFLSFTGGLTIRKIDADNPTVGIPGAVIRITGVKLDDGGSFTGTYTTGQGGYISKEDLDFTTLPKGSYVAEEITPPEGYILSSDVSKVKQTFVWDGKTDVSLIFENSARVKVQLKKVDESGKPLAGAIFIILHDGQIIGTEETGADGTITVSNVTEGYLTHPSANQLWAKTDIHCGKRSSRHYQQK